jgi:hypothetical protein
MDAFASPSTRRPRWASRAAPAGWALAAAALGLCLMGAPLAPDARLDASWQLMLIHAHAAGLQFGRDIIFTWGPLGYLCNAYHMGASGAGAILAWQTAGQLLVAVAALALTRGLAPWRRAAFAVLFACTHWLFFDSEYFVIICLVVVSGMMRADARLPSVAGWALALGFLSQFKFTYLILCAAGALAAAACWAGRRAWPRAATAAGAYGASVLASWCAAGQEPGNLYSYVRRSLEVTWGYGAAMGTDESPALFLWGAAVALSCALGLALAWRAAPERAFGSAACAFLALAFLLMWKESFTRADFIPLGGHVFGMFVCALVLSPVLTGLLLPGRRLHCLDILAPLCLAAFAQFDGALYLRGPRVVWERMDWCARSLVRLGGLPSEWQADYERACARSSLPRIGAQVGAGTVDVYDFSTAAALMNGLALDARPIFQGYSAYTPGLEGWNYRFYQSARAPDYLLWSEERMDDRYPGMDDAMLVAALPGRYLPLLREGDYWLLKRRSALAAGTPVREVVLNRTVWLGEEVPLPADRGHAILAAANAVTTARGRLRGLLYKPPALFITTTDDGGSVHAWRVVPAVARAGFILAPLIARGDDAAAFMQFRYRTWIRSFHFDAPAGQAGFWSHVDVTLFTMPSLPMSPAGDDASASKENP